MPAIRFRINRDERRVWDALVTAGLFRDYAHAARTAVLMYASDHFQIDRARSVLAARRRRRR